MNFQNWEILRGLSGKFLDTVEMAWVTGDAANTAFVITNDDKVFGIGKNIKGCLGGNDYNVSFYGLPSEISSLSKKGVQGIVCGGDGKTEIFTVAYLHSGEIYSWGNIPTTESITNIPKQIGRSFKIQVKAVVCGKTHCAILSNAGEVFTWGKNECGQLGRTDVHVTKIRGNKWSQEAGSCEPDKVKGIIEGQTVIDISCGYKFTVVLLADGRVVSWGKNDVGQLGLNGCGTFTASPSEVSTLRNYYDCVIEKVACGRNHVLALDKTGTLYAWGNNKFGQLGKKNIPSDKLGCPMEVEINNLRVIDISAANLHNISVARCANGMVYMWGQTKQGDITKITETECESIDEVFESFAVPKAMLKPMRRLKSTTMEYNHVETLPETVEKEYNNPDTSDLKIIVDDKEIHAHQSILKMRSEYFNTMISRWLDKDENVSSITIKEKSFAAIEAYVKHLYTDKLEVDLSLAVELTQLADEYRDDKFRSVCEETIRRMLTVDVVADVFASTRKHENFKNVNQLCLDFALRHAPEVMNSSGFETWDTDTMKAFMSEYVKVKGHCR